MLHDITGPEPQEFSPIPLSHQIIPTRAGILNWGPRDSLPPELRVPVNANEGETVFTTLSVKSDICFYYECRTQNTIVFLAEFVTNIFIPRRVCYRHSRS